MEDEDDGLTYHQRWIKNNPYYYQDYYQVNKDRLRDYQKVYKTEHKQELKAYQKKYQREWLLKRRAEILEAKKKKFHELQNEEHYGQEFV